MKLSRILAGILLSIGWVLSAIGAQVELTELPTLWVVTYSNTADGGSGYAMLTNTGALNSVSKPCLTKGTLNTGPSVTADEERFLFNLVQMAKFTQTKVTLTYENTTCELIEAAVSKQ